MSTSMIVRGANENIPGGRLYVHAFSMGSLATFLTMLGMAFESDPPDFPWDEFDNLKSDPDHYEEAGVPVSPRAKRVEEQVQQVRRAHGQSGRSGIPEHKLWIDEGQCWHVTKQECRDAITIYDKLVADGEPHPQELEVDVIPFLRLAAQCDGFTVTR